jgi:hypothetical protein
MSYQVSQLTTVAECDQLIQMANDAKGDLQFAEVGLTRRNNGRMRTATRLAATLATVEAQIAAFTAARDAMPEGPDKDSMSSRLRRLNDRMENLEESRSRSGAVALLDTDFDRAMITAQLAEVNNFIAAIEARKTVLEEPEEEQG